MSGRTHQQLTFTAAVLLAATLTATAHPPQMSPTPAEEPTYSMTDLLEFQAAFSISNRYVTEGIDNVPGTPLVFSEAAVSYEAFELGIWYAEALADAYNEVIPYLQYTLDLDPVEIFGGINYVWYPSAQDPDSWEIYGGIEYTPIQWLTVFLESYYDFDEIRGGFIETGVIGTIPFPDDRVEINPYALVGIDYGYVSGSRRLKENNFQFGVEISLQVSENVAFFGNVNRSLALANLNSINEGNVTWGGGGIRLTFQ